MEGPLTSWDDIPVVADQTTLARIRERMWDWDTRQLTDYVLSLGLRPPDGRGGWLVTPAFDPQGNPHGPFWTAPGEGHATEE